MNKFRRLIILIVLCIYGTASAQSPGSVSPNVKVIVHADKFYSFHEGYAVLMNDNSSSAVINAAGDIVIPYNKFQIKNDFDYTGFVNGMCQITDASHKLGVINKAGKIIFPVQFSYITDFFEGNFAYAQRYMIDASLIIRKDGTSIPVEDKDAKGKKMFLMDRVDKQHSAWANGLHAISNWDVQQHWGYINSNAKIAIPLIYLQARAFSEGLAAVAKKDDFGNIKWGFINTAGKVVIPFQYSNEPGAFSSGLSLVKPLNIPDFKYCYIDKTGSIVIKIKEDISLGYGDGRFHGNFAIWEDPDKTYPESKGLLSMDKTGKTIRLNDYALKAGYHDISYRPAKTNDVLFLTGSNNITKSYGVGMISLDGTIILPPVFNDLKEFDPVSDLAYAEFGHGENLVKGYINRSGVFVIIQGKKSGF